MNSKDYKLIAKSIKQNLDAMNCNREDFLTSYDYRVAKSRYMGAYHVAHNMASRLSTYRDNFNKKQFLKDCGLSD